MIGSLLALMMLTAQPAPEQPAEPVETEAEAEVQVQVETPVVDAEVAAEAEAQAQAQAQPSAEPAPVEPASAAQGGAGGDSEAEPADPQEELICRRRLRPSERIGQRHRVVEDCRTRAEWESARRRR